MKTCIFLLYKRYRGTGSAASGQLPIMEARLIEGPETHVPRNSTELVTNFTLSPDML